MWLLVQRTALDGVSSVSGTYTTLNNQCVCNYHQCSGLKSNLWTKVAHWQHYICSGVLLSLFMRMMKPTSKLQEVQKLSPINYGFKTLLILPHGPFCTANKITITQLKPLLQVLHPIQITPSESEHWTVKDGLHFGMITNKTLFKNGIKPNTSQL